jgi:hypothetical protein
MLTEEKGLRFRIEKLEERIAPSVGLMSLSACSVSVKMEGGHDCDYRPPEHHDCDYRPPEHHDCDCRPPEHHECAPPPRCCPPPPRCN